MAFQGYSSLKALVIDDFNNFRITVIKMLEEFGCQDVVNAVNGSGAIKACKERSFDLVLCDYNLGQGKNGQQVLEDLRVRGLLKRQSIFLMVSAESSMSIVLSAYDYSPDAYLTKPITGNTLRKRLDRLLAQRSEMLPVYESLESGDVDSAIARAMSSIKAGSRYSTAYQKLLGDLYLKEDKLDEAEAIYKQVLEVRMLDWAQVGMAKVKMAKNEPDTATVWLKKIIASHPYCLSAYDLLAEAYERKGDFESKQKVLESAVHVSPKSILRQSSLAQTAEKNNDLSVAAKAYSRSVRLGAHSCHDKVENHIQLGRVGVQLFNEHDASASDISKEALRTLDAAGKRFSLDKQMRVQTRMLECQLLSKRGEKVQAAKIFEEIGEQLDLMESLNLDSELDLVNTYKALGREDEAEHLIHDLLERYQQDEVALEKIDQLLEEPVSLINRKKVAKLNKEGIGYYNAGESKAAVECFTRARRLFPNHLGVLLNLVQALTAEMKAFGISDDHMDVCLTVLKKVESNISNEHKQFNRYRQLQEMVRRLSQEAEQG